MKPSVLVIKKNDDDDDAKETGNGNVVTKVDKVELTENLDKQKVDNAAGAIKIKDDHVTSTNITKTEKITTKSNNKEEITSNVLLSMLTSTEEKNEKTVLKSEKVTKIEKNPGIKNPSDDVANKNSEKIIKELENKNDKKSEDNLKSATSQREITKTENIKKEEILNVKVEEENVAIKKDQIKNETEMEKPKICSTTSKDASKEISEIKLVQQQKQEEKIQIKKSLVKKETLIYDETKDILITTSSNSNKKEENQQKSSEEKSVKIETASSEDEIPKKIKNIKTISKAEPKIEKSNVVFKESDPNR